MHYITFEVNPGRWYRTANFVMSHISKPSPNITLGRGGVSRDPYEEKISRVRSRMFELVHGEPLQEINGYGTTAGLGLSRLPVGIILKFSEEPSNGLVDKIRKIKSVRNVQTSQDDLKR